MGLFFNKGLLKAVIICVLTSFILQPVPVVAQSKVPLDQVSSFFEYPGASLKGLKVIPSQGLKLQFLFDDGARQMGREQLEKLVRVFMAGLTFDAKEIWVNLSPFEPERIMSPLLAVTELGQIMAQQDYILKQRASLLTHPDAETGSRFWAESFKMRRSLHEQTNSISFTPKVWIVPDQAEVYHLGQEAILGKMHLKVMVEEDYLAAKKSAGLGLGHSDVSASLTTDVMRKIICPVLEKEVNESSEFQPLRHVYQALILAHWFKTFHVSEVESLDYVQRAKIKGIDVVSNHAVNDIFNQYRLAYKKGAYNFIREGFDEHGQETARKYFSGGLTFDPKVVSYLAPNGNKVSWLGRIRNQIKGWMAATVVFAAIMSSSSLQADQLKGAERLMKLSAKPPIVQTAPKPTHSAINYSVSVQKGGPSLVKLGQKAQPMFSKSVLVKPAPSGNKEVVKKGIIKKEAAKTEAVKKQVVNKKDLRDKDKKEGLNKRVDNQAPIINENNASSSSPYAITGSSVPLAPDVREAAGSPPDDDPWAKVMQKPIFKDLDSSNQEPSKSRALNISSNGEMGFLSNNNPGIVLNADLQLEENLGRGYSASAGIHSSISPSMGMSTDQPNEPMGLLMMADAPQRSNEMTVSPFFGIHKTGEYYGYYFQLQDIKNFKLGIESRPVYNHGFSYIYGASVIGYDSLEGYQFGGQLEAYLSFSLAKLYPWPNDFLNKIYLSFTMESVFAQEGVGVGGGLRLSYDDRFQAYVEFNPLRDLPMMHDVFGHMDMMGSRIGLSYRVDGRVSVFSEIVKPIGDRDEEQVDSYLFGLRWKLGKRVFNHGDLDRSPNFNLFPRDGSMLGSQSGSPPPPKDAQGAINRRSFIRNLAVAAVGVVANVSTMLPQAQQNPEAENPRRIDSVYKVDPDKDPVCGLPIVILGDDDKIQEAHMVYLAFMYWYLKDESNDWIDFNSSEKREFLDMNLADWYDFFTERKISERHRRLVRVIQSKLHAETQRGSVKIPEKDEIKIDGKLFTRQLRQWMERYIYFLRKNQSPQVRINYLHLMDGIAKSIIRPFIRDYVKKEDVLNFIRSEGYASTNSLKAILDKWEEFYNQNPEIILKTAQWKLSKEGYQGIIVNGEIDNMPMIKAVVSKLKSKRKDEAMEGRKTGGVDFTQISKVISWKVPPLKQVSFQNKNSAVMGMTFDIVEYKPVMEIYSFFSIN